MVEFIYSEFEKELRVDDIFIKVFNNDIYYRPRDPIHFLQSLLLAIHDHRENRDNLSELLRALRNLICF